MAAPVLVFLPKHVVYVMRHGRTILDDTHRADGWLDYPLSDDGRLGLIEAQQYLKYAPITKVYAADLRRVEETAHIISSGILSHPPVEAVRALRTWNLGELVGGKKKHNKPIVRFFMDNPNEKPLGGESLREFYTRFYPWIYDLIEKCRDGKGPFLVVGSGSNLRAIGKILTGSNDTFDMDEGGMICLHPTDGGIGGDVVFGHKREDREDYS